MDEIYASHVLEHLGYNDELPSAHEELYLVTAGAATFTVDGETVEAPSGTLVHVPDHSVVYGNPATVVRRYDSAAGRWNGLGEP